MVLFSLIFPGLTYRIQDPDDLKNQNPRKGYADIRYEGQWGSICSQGWDDIDAAVFCRRLGFVDGKALQVVNSTF